jgi:hypothetical protein
VSPLSPQHGMSSCCGWRRRPPDIEVAAIILNKQSQTADRGCPPAWGLGGGLTTPPPTIKTLTCYETYHTASNQDAFFGKTTQALRFGTCDIRSLCRIGSLKTVARELRKDKLDLVGVQEVRWEKDGT